MDSTIGEELAYALKVAIQFLPEDRQATPADVATAVSTAVAVVGLKGVTVDPAMLTKIVEGRTNVFQEDSSGLRSDEDHVPWLADAKNDRTWSFWQRYERFLTYVRDMPLSVVRGIDRSTDEVLGELEDPQRPGPWRRTGLVIGQVQSGKTGQFIGLASKAADVGYRLIVVFAGVHNDLRAQTQLRIDEGLLGFDTQYQLRSDEEGANRYIGVGAMAGSERLPAASLTNSAEKGDFDRKTASKANLPIGNFPVVLVVKKHPKIINYLRTWVTEVHGDWDSDKGRKIVRDVPLFVIDDEADNASINTADPEADPTKINAAVRDLVQSFDKASYVGYTATPFANIYINPDADHDFLGSDLFPDSFIRTLRAPSNYLGPERLFGLRAFVEDEDDIDPLPLVRHVEDATAWIPDKHKSNHVPSTDLPDTLVRAIQSFVLTCAARRARGQVNVHNSMLVHVTRFTNVQGHVRNQVDDYVRLLQSSLRDRYGTASAKVLAELHQLWKDDFESTTSYFPADEARRLTWEEVTAELLPAIQKFQVKAINGAAKDALDYYENRHKGLSVIAVGGQKLSRGLTLEGLSVSYYLRFSKTYDTLLQMGRWFGYRTGYEDLCRLYMTPTLESAYQEITAATDELRRDVEEMAALGLTPRQFGLKVRTSSLGLSITAANKMRQGTKVRLSYSGELAESTIFPLGNGVPKKNFDNLEAFVARLLQQAPPQVDEGTGALVWKNVPAEEVATGFFDSYEAARESSRIRPKFISGYIRQCARFGELGNWTVRIVSRRDGADTVGLAGHTVGLVTRAASKTGLQSETRHTIKRVLSPRDESLDLDETQRKAALDATRRAAEGKLKRNGEPRDPSVPTGAPLRAQRRTDQPLLLLYLIKAPERSGLKVPLVGFAASFPFSGLQGKTEYVVNDVWWTEGPETDDDLYEDEDEQ